MNRLKANEVILLALMALTFALALVTSANGDAEAAAVLWLAFVYLAK